MRAQLLVFIVALSSLVDAQAPSQRDRADAVAVIEAAAARMGGFAALDSLATIRYELITQWLSITPDAPPRRDGPTYERHSEWRDHAAGVWRNERRFPTATGWQEYTDVVEDTVAARIFAPGSNQPASIPTYSASVDGVAPLNVAYVDERRQVFAWSPERLLTVLRGAEGLTLLRDTTIRASRHRVVQGRINGVLQTVFFSAETQLPALLRYVADDTNDFGLAPWGIMTVEVWYSRWAPVPSSSALLPRQWDTWRHGRPYKRTSVLSVARAAMPQGTVPLPDTVRSLFFASTRRAMGDLPVDSSASDSSGRLHTFYGFGAPGGAVRLGDRWILVDGANLTVNAERALARLSPPGQLAVDAIISGGQPGAVALFAALAGGSVWSSARMTPEIRRMLDARNVRSARVTPVTKGRWLSAAAGARDSLWIEPIELSNGAAILLYDPGLAWAYAPATNRADLELLRERLARRGWPVRHIGMPGRFLGR